MMGRPDEIFFFFFTPVFFLKEPSRSPFQHACVLTKVVKTNQFIWQGKYLLEKLHVLCCSLKTRYKNRTLKAVLIHLFSSTSKQNKDMREKETDQI